MAVPILNKYSLCAQGLWKEGHRGRDCNGVSPCVHTWAVLASAREPGGLPMFPGAHSLSRAGTSRRDAQRPQKGEDLSRKPNLVTRAGWYILPPLLHETCLDRTGSGRSHGVSPPSPLTLHTQRLTGLTQCTSTWRSAQTFGSHSVLLLNT